MVPTTLLLLAGAAVGVDTGWSKLDSGGYEYIIQISPEQLESLRNGGEFGSDLPTDTGAIRSYKIVVGSGPIVNQGVPLPAEARVSLKPTVTDNGTAKETEDAAKVSAQKLQAGSGRPQRDFFDNSAPAAATKLQDDKSGASGAQEDEDLLERPSAFSNRNRGPINLVPADKGVGNVADAEKDKANDNKKVTADTDETDGPGADTPATEEVEPTKKAESEFWWYALVLIVIFQGCLNSYFLFLAWDFRNRYLELLRDLDTQSSPVEEPMTRYESSQDGEEEAAVDERESRRSQRGAMAYMGRKGSRDKDDEAYDEE